MPVDRAHVTQQILALYKKLTPKAQRAIRRRLELESFEAEIATATTPKRRGDWPPKWWTISEAAEFIGKNKSTVSRKARKWLTNGCKGRKLRVHFFNVLQEFLKAAGRCYRKYYKCLGDPEQRDAWEEVFEAIKQMEDTITHCVMVLEGKGQQSDLPNNILISDQFLEIARRLKTLMRNW